MYGLPHSAGLRNADGVVRRRFASLGGLRQFQIYQPLGFYCVRLPQTDGWYLLLQHFRPCRRLIVVVTPSLCIVGVICFFRAKKVGVSGRVDGTVAHLELPLCVMAMTKFIADDLA